MAAEGGRERGGEEGGELRRTETLNRLHFPQILPFPLLPQAGGEAASTALRVRSPGLALPPGTASGPPPKFDPLSLFLSLSLARSLTLCLFLLLPFRWKQKKSEAGASAAPGLLESWAWRGRPRS